MAHAALRRTVAFEFVSWLVSDSNAGCPIDARASAACSPGDECLKLSSAGLQRVPSQHLMSSVLASSPNMAISFGIASTAFFCAAAQAAWARSWAFELSIACGAEDCRDVPVEMGVR